MRRPGEAFLQLRRSVAQEVTVGGEVKKVDVVVIVTYANRSAGIDAESLAEPGGRGAFVDLLGKYLEPDRGVIQRRGSSNDLITG